MRPGASAGLKNRPYLRRRRPAHTRSGMSLVYAIVALGAMLVLGLIFLQIGLNSGKWAYSYYRDQQAFALAESAIDRAIWMMQASAEGESGINTQLAMTEGEAAAGAVATFTSPVWTLPTGSYSFVVRSPYKGVFGTAEIRATGLSRGGTNQESVASIINPHFPDPGGSDTIPADCFKHAMFSDHNMSVKGSPQVLGHPEAGGAGLYANGNIDFSGGASVIYGPIVATGVITGTTTQVPVDAGRNEHAPRVRMPVIDLAYYKSRAALLYSGNNVKLTSGHDASAGTYENPKIIFVDGSVSIAGNFEGVGMIVATKAIKVTGNCTYGSPGSSWAFMTAGSFTVAGNAQIFGLVYAHNADGSAEFIGHGTPNIFGGVVADVITITGNYTTEWDGEAVNIDELPGTERKLYPPVVETLLWERV